MSPKRARVIFSLDPWGREQMYGVHTPLQRNYNARFRQIGVALYASDALHDCSNVSGVLNSNQCSQNAFVSYNLTQFSPAWTSSFSGEWRRLGYPAGYIEQGHAVFNENGITELTNLDTLSPQFELFDRPLGGTYELEIYVGDEPADGDIDWSKLEGVQVLMSYDYWSKQQ